MKNLSLGCQINFSKWGFKEEIYVEQPTSIIVASHEDKVYRHHKALCGLKQALRAWYNIIDSHFLQNDFRRSQNEHTLCVKGCGNGKKIIVSLYVDDFLVTCDDVDEIGKFKSGMLQVFEMTDLGEMKYFWEWKWISLMMQSFSYGESMLLIC